MFPCLSPSLGIYIYPGVAEELAEFQDQEFGHGTTPVVILASELLKEAGRTEGCAEPVDGVEGFCRGFCRFW